MEEKDLKEQPGWSNTGGSKGPWARNPDGTIPDDAAPPIPDEHRQSVAKATSTPTTSKPTEAPAKPRASRKK
jgi:hypothetical protein